MRANPEPIVVTSPLTSQGTVTAANLDSVDSALPGEAERRMPGSCLEQRELFIRELLNVRWELVLALPERLQRV